ncbi:hypothetical protein FRC01_005115 [Tulasnella sp. 417]|nr:hypothetical protein FRC01_005115 [Tulasnella sp. 417]
MALPDEAPFTPQEVEEVLSLVHNVFGPIQQYSILINSVAVAPAVFLQLPVYQERLQCLIDSFSTIYDLLPQSVFCQHMDAMLDCRDALTEAEQRAPLASDPTAAPLFGELEWEDGPNGPRLSIPRDLVETLMYDVNLTNQEIAAILREYKIICQKELAMLMFIQAVHSTLSDEELYELIYNYKTTVGMFFGERAIFGLLTAQHHWAPRWKIRQIIRQIDPLGVETRWKRAILRRTYSVPFPNSLWHIDGHHKLIRWKIVTHGGIDGKSRLVVYLRASDNNRAETVATAFEEATRRYGWPSRVRADWGGENVIVQRMMEDARGPGRGSFLAGASTHNQRIERLWQDVFTWTIQAFYTLFTAMETQGILNPDDRVHLWALHLIFLPRINHALGIFVETWNNHKLSTAQNQSPSALWLRGM